MRVLRSNQWRSRQLSGCVLGALCLPLLAGCGGGGGGGSSPAPPASVLTVTGTTAHGLTVTLSENTATITAGGSLVYTSTVTNKTAAAITVQATSLTPTTPASTLLLKDPSNNTVMLGNPPGAPPLYNFSLASGQSLTTTQTVTAFTTHGIYNATATFQDDPTGPITVGPLAVTVQ